MLGLFFALFLSAGGLYINYYCSYKKPGTKLLLLNMIMIPLNLIATFFKAEHVAFMQTSIFFSLFMLTFLIYDLSVFYYSYQLRRINKRRQGVLFTTSSVYLDALSVFATAANLDELDEQFRKLQNTHPAESMLFLDKAHETAKGHLKLASNSVK